jgi:integrase
MRRRASDGHLDTLPTGIVRTPYGFRAYVRVDGHLYPRRFPPTATVKEMVAWRETQRVLVRHGLAQPAVAAGVSFRAQVRTYLAGRQSMPSYADRELHMLDWAKAFGDRDPASVTAPEIRIVIERLRTRLKPGSCNKRRSALMSFYTAINGRSGYNPVRDVPKYQEETEPRAQSFGTIYRLLALMPASKTRARLRVLLWTGWPHAQIRKLEPSHLDLAHARAWVTARRKGKGKAGGWLPLLRGAVVALRAFVAADAFGPFSTSAMHISFRRALKKLNQRRARFGHYALKIRPYDLRHSFGTMLAERQTDDRAIQEMMRHSTPQQTLRYTEAATSARVAAAVAKIDG